MDCVYFSPGYCAIKEDTCPCPRQTTKEEAAFEEAEKLFNDELDYKKMLCKFGGNSEGGKKHKKPVKKKKIDYFEEV